MKRFGNLKYRWCSYDALLDAWLEVKRHKSYSLDVISYENNLAVNLSELLDKLSDGSYVPRPLKIFTIYYPKERIIEAPYLEDRIVQHSLVNVIRPIIESKFIDHTFACIKDRGTHKASDALFKYLQSFRNRGYYLKVDIKKFFYSINHSVLISMLDRIIKCPDTLSLLKKFFVNDSGIGLPLGNLTSQLLANFVLSPLDHFIRRSLKIKYYLRYMDDMILLHRDRDVLRDAKSGIVKFINDILRLEANNKTKISKISHGIDFVGFRTWYYMRLLKQRTFKVALRAVDSASGPADVLSYLAHAKNTYSLPFILNKLQSVSPLLYFSLRPALSRWSLNPSVFKI